MILSEKDIDRAEWGALVASSATGTWFQTPEAYSFFASMPELYRPFVVGLENEGKLRAICVGYVTVEKNAVKQFMMRRAIIVGGPALADNCSEDEVVVLMGAVRKQLQSSAIYVETRNFNDYSRWKETFASAGFSYEPHLNFHVHTDQGWETVEENIGKHRKKYIRLSFRDGATVTVVPNDGMSREQSSLNEPLSLNDELKLVKDYYEILKDLYKTKVKMPLQPWEFFEKLYHCPSCKYLLVMFDGQVVGGSICMLLPGHGVYEWYACGKDGVFKNIHPSSVTKYAGMKYACDNGYAVFDMMGAGKPDEEYGVRDFKAEFGGELVEHGRFLCVTKPLLYRIGVLGVKILKKIK
jgi:hypothetical protein